MEEKNAAVYEEIISNIDIIETISKYILLDQPSGTYHEGKCPFTEHCGKSFVVSKEKRSWYCFGCHARGDVISFIAKIGNMNKTTAARFLDNLRKSKTWSNHGTIQEEAKE